MSSTFDLLDTQGFSDWKLDFLSDYSTNDSHRLGISNNQQADEALKTSAANLLSQERLLSPFKSAQSNHLGLNSGCVIAEPMTSLHSHQHSHHELEDTVSSRFQTQGSKWSQPFGKGTALTVTYAIDNSFGLAGLRNSQVRGLVREALQIWSRYAPINFQEVRDPGNGNFVDILMQSNYIDGSGNNRGNTLAFAYFPRFGGDITFDSGERWNTSLFLETAVHEIGHSLGLEHESGTSAIMNPSIQNRYSGPGSAFLFRDDVNGIRAIYGSGRGSVDPLRNASGLVASTKEIHRDASSDILNTQDSLIASSFDEFFVHDELTAFSQMASTDSLLARPIDVLDDHAHSLGSSYQNSDIIAGCDCFGSNSSGVEEIFNTSMQEYMGSVQTV